MTDAERAKRYRRNRTDHLAEVKRACRRELGFLDAFTDADLVDALRNDVSLVNTKGKRGTAPARKRIAALVAELASRYPV